MHTLYHLGCLASLSALLGHPAAPLVQKEAELIKLAAAEQAALDHALEYGLVHPHHCPPAIGPLPSDAERVGHAALGYHHLCGLSVPAVCWLLSQGAYKLSYYQHVTI
jgi:hypothetical protein